MSNIVLYVEKKECCGCGACVNACPKNAISMVEDEHGFVYPKIDFDLCIECGKCKRTCAYQSQVNMLNVQDVHAAMAKDEELIMKSASGGVFATIGRAFLEKGGVLFGCSMEYENNKLIPRHIKVENMEGLRKIQGSKYVQSEMGMVYQEAQKELLAGRKVLFSGTPCQIAALKRYLNKEYDNLYTIDIICHGVPSVKFFQDYISILEKKIKGKILKFYFRDKKDGWGLRGSLLYRDMTGNERFKTVPVRLSSYYKLFLESHIYRENCYECKYANSSRIGDITIGDYWGIEKEHPDYLTINGGNMDEKKGVSCLLVNNKQGKVLLDEYAKELYLEKSCFEKAARKNGQLNLPSKKSDLRNQILEMYAKEGYIAVEKWYNKRLGAKKYLFIIYTKLPLKVQKMLKK